MTHRADASTALDNRGYTGPLIRGQNPALLFETAVRDRITDSLYWKEQCFGLNAATLLDRAVDLSYIGGTYGVGMKPTPFLCLAFKLLTLVPDREIVLEYLNSAGDEWKYVRALAAFYVRLTFDPSDVYKTLEPFLEDARKLKRRRKEGYVLVHMDEFVDELLTKERSCATSLWKLPPRQLLEDLEQLEPRESPLQDDHHLGFYHQDDHLDDESAELILKLLLEEVESFKGNCKGKQKAGDADDGEYAATLLEDDLHQLEASLRDRRMTRSIANAVQTDGGLIEQSAQEEQAACTDHDLAHHLSGSSNAKSSVLPQPEELDDVLLSQLAGRYVSEETGHALASSLGQLRVPAGEITRAEGSSGPSSSHRGKNRRDNPNNNGGVCGACQEPKPFFDLIQAPCQHEYCLDCLRDLFNASLTDEGLFPPRCCRTPIPLKSVAIYMPKQLKDTFAEKEIEFSTLNRTYCSQATCSAFINPANISKDIATCQKCSTQTCSICKAAAHIGSDCPEDPNQQALLDLAREAGWQHCNECRSLVEISTGCNHMTYMPLRGRILLRMRCALEALPMPPVG
ncbi:hypothetical protein DV735_g2460, partial [Chaetothyriales sp. CBS 134920]